MDIYEKLYGCIGFQWDEGNVGKIWEKHKVTPAECEQIFFHMPLVATEDTKHSEKELRFFVLGQTDMDRRLFAAFTIRKKLIRVISTRDMSRRERKEYERL
jgi:uncharacterized DUF497 family protein